MQISRAAFDLIVAEEVTSEAVYRKKYQRPEWPKGQSGVTVGIGYDLGQTPETTVRADWSGRVSPAMLEYMVSACDVTGTPAARLTAQLHDKISIPWETALAVHEQRVLPRWEDKTRKVLPNFDRLHPDCKGALVSLTFNRGPSFIIPASKDAKGRYREMRAIKAHMAAEDFDAIPSEFRSMKRLWTTKANTGVRKRRDTEAKLFEKGLRSMAAGGSISAPVEDAPSEVPAIAARAEPVPAVLLDKDVRGDPEIFSVQKRLKAMNYYSGVVDGKWGGKTSEGISGFVNDRMFHMGVPTSLEMFNDVREFLKDELARAESESPPWKRPVSDERASADPKVLAEIAPDIVPAKQSWLAQRWTALLLLLGSLWETVSAKVLGIWEFYTGHKDDLPDGGEGLLTPVWNMLGKVPLAVWLLLGAVLVGALALRTGQGVKLAENAVKTGAR